MAAAFITRVIQMNNFFDSRPDSFTTCQTEYVLYPNVYLKYTFFSLVTHVKVIKVVEKSGDYYFVDTACCLFMTSECK